VFDRLFSDSRSHLDGLLPTQTIEQLRDAVARDLEWLMNSRSALGMNDRVFGQLVSRSVLLFGVDDFSGLLMSSNQDRQKIARSLASAIETHEPRLRQVTIDFKDTQASVGALGFTIRAMLVVTANREAVSFDAVLQPAVSKYQVTHSQFSSYE
jgi:type VI secretion system protein ImpF